MSFLDEVMEEVKKGLIHPPEDPRRIAAQRWMASQDPFAREAGDVIDYDEDPSQDPEARMRPRGTVYDPKTSNPGTFNFPWEEVRPGGLAPTLPEQGNPYAGDPQDLGEEGLQVGRGSGVPGDPTIVRDPTVPEWLGPPSRTFTLPSAPNLRARYWSGENLMGRKLDADVVLDLLRKYGRI